MNEPNANVGLVILAVVFSAPVAIALLIIVTARRGAWTVWLVWAIAFYAFLSIAQPVAASFSINATDEAMFKGLIVGTGVATAASAWVVNRAVRKDPDVSRWRLAGYSLLTSIALMILAIRASC